MLHPDQSADISRRLVGPDDRRVLLHEAGRGEIPVVILHGAGDSISSWSPVLEELALSGRVIGYDRSGLGGSPPGPAPTLERYVAELREVINRERLAPAVLVAHSLGGLIAQVYAARFPAEVAALVLVDATPDAVAEEPSVRAGFKISGVVASLLKAGAPWGLIRLLAWVRALPMYPEQLRYRQLVGEAGYHQWVEAVEASFARGAAAELRSVIPSARGARQDASLQRENPFAEMPVAVVSSRAYGRKWLAMQRGLADRSRRSFLLETGGRSHNVHMSSPGLVVEAVETVREHLTRVTAVEDA